jgi:hypothetical protein
VTAQVQCCFDVFDRLLDSFKSTNGIFVTVQKPDASLVFSSTNNDSRVLSSSLFIGKSEQCEIQMTDSIAGLKMSFPLTDFIVAVTIAKQLNRRMLIYSIQPRPPGVVKANIAVRVDFKIAQAAALERHPADRLGGLFAGITVDEESIGEAGKRRRSAAAIDAVGRERNRTKGLFSESPTFPLMKRVIGQCAERSQPPSDDSAESLTFVCWIEEFEEWVNDSDRITSSQVKLRLR